MEESVQHLIDLKRHMNSIEHQLYVSCKFTRTTEMLRTVMQSIIQGYELFFGHAYSVLIGEQYLVNSVHDKIQLLGEAMSQRGIGVDLSEYVLLKKLMLTDFDAVGEYRKNLAMISYIDGEEYTVNLQKLLEFYGNLKAAFDNVQSL